VPTVRCGGSWYGTTLEEGAGCASHDTVSRDVTGDAAAGGRRAGQTTATPTVRGRRDRPRGRAPVTSSFPGSSASWLLRPPGSLPRGAVTTAAVGAIAILGVAASRTPELPSLGLLHLIPVALATAVAGARRGTALALLATLVWAATVRPATTAAAPIAAEVTVRALGLLFVVALVQVTVAQLRLASHLSSTDELTGLPNRRAFVERAELELARMRRTGATTTVAYLDVDGFKAVNDGHGHERGDEVLRRIADVLTQRLRATDLAARLGGDEFAILLLDTDATHASSLLRSLRTAIATETMARGLPVTVSVGATTYRRAPASVTALLRQPDALLYEVKRDGGHAVRHVVHRPVRRRTPAPDVSEDGAR
jgi:diguanylate cyclase (GGDEF)-like protein